MPQTNRLGPDWAVAADSTIVRAHQHAAGARPKGPGRRARQGAQGPSCRRSDAGRVPGGGHRPAQRRGVRTGTAAQVDAVGEQRRQGWPAPRSNGGTAPCAWAAPREDDVLGGWIDEGRTRREPAIQVVDCLSRPRNRGLRVVLRTRSRGPDFSRPGPGPDARARAQRCPRAVAVPQGLVSSGSRTLRRPWLPPPSWRCRWPVRPGCSSQGWAAGEPKFSSTSTGSGPQQALPPSVTFTAAAA